MDWAHAVSLATDGAPAIAGPKTGCKWRDTFLDTVLQVLKMDHVMRVIVPTANIVHTRVLNHCQFDSLLHYKGIVCGLLYQAKVTWLSRPAVFH